jgi:hypothetical protein
MEIATPRREIRNPGLGLGHRRFATECGSIPLPMLYAEGRTIVTSRFGALSTIAVTGFLGFALWSTYAVFVWNRTDLHVENGLIENTQVVLLLIACLAFLAPIAFETRSNKLILLFYSLLCYSFILRELEVQEFDIPEVLIFIGSGVGRNIIGTVAFTAIVSYALFHFSYYKKAAIEFLSSRSGILVLLGGGFLFLGHGIENQKALIHHEYFEEIFELCGYVFILLAACAVNSCFTHQSTLRSLPVQREKPMSPERPAFPCPPIHRPGADGAVVLDRGYHHDSLIGTRDRDYEVPFASFLALGSPVSQVGTQEGFPAHPRDVLGKALDKSYAYVEQDAPIPMKESCERVCMLSFVQRNGDGF